MSETELFMEVDDDLRRDRHMRLWKKYGKYLIGAVLLILAGVAAFEAWRHFREVQLREAGDALYARIVDRQAASGDAGALLAFAGTLPDGPKSIAWLQAGARLARKGRYREAAAAFDLVVHAHGEEPLGEVAALLGALVLVGQAPRDEIDKRISRFTVSPGSPFRFIAREIGAWAALRAGNDEQALAVFRSLADDTEAPPGIRRRALDLLTLLHGSGAPS